MELSSECTGLHETAANQFLGLLEKQRQSPAVTPVVAAGRHPPPRNPIPRSADKSLTTGASENPASAQPRPLSRDFPSGCRDLNPGPLDPQAFASGAPWFGGVRRSPLKWELSPDSCMEIQLSSTAWLHVRLHRQNRGLEEQCPEHDQHFQSPWLTLVHRRLPSSCVRSKAESSRSSREKAGDRSRRRPSNTLPMLSQAHDCRRAPRAPVSLAEERRSVITFSGLT